MRVLLIIALLVFSGCASEVPVAPSSGGISRVSANTLAGTMNTVEVSTEAQRFNGIWIGSTFSPGAVWNLSNRKLVGETIELTMREHVECSASVFVYGAEQNAQFLMLSSIKGVAPNMDETCKSYEGTYRYSFASGLLYLVRLEIERHVPYPEGMYFALIPANQ